MFLANTFTRYFTYYRYPLFCTYIRTLNTYDKHFYYFRGKTDYRNSVVQLNDDLTDSKVAGPGLSFLLKEHDIKTDGFFFHLMHRENVMKLSNAQLKDILCWMANIKIDSNKYSSALRYLDEKCTLSVERWPLDLSLYILDAWFIILGPKIFRKHYYSAVTSVWSRKIRKCSKFNLILMLYFIGMSKVAPPFLMEMLEDKMETFIHEFTDEEWSIACLSFFKTSKKIKSELLLKHSCQVAENLILKNDSFNLISILKCLRLSKYYDEKLWILLNEFIVKKHKEFNFVECTNYLATFASQNVYSDKVFSCLENQGISVLSQEKPSCDSLTDFKMHPSDRSRVKDMARFLWAIANVGHSMKENNIDFIINQLSQRLDIGEFEIQNHILIDCLQSLVLIGFYPCRLMEYICTASFVRLASETNKAKPKYQLYFVLKSAKIENPDIFHEHQNLNFLNPIPKNLQKDIKEREGFRGIVNVFQQNLPENSFKCCYIIPHIMIAGIIINTSAKALLACSKDEEKINLNTIKSLIEKGIISKQAKDVFQDNSLHTCIEILDPSVCVYGSVIPLGLMKTKIRQLKTLHFNVLTLTPCEIETIIQSRNIKQSTKITDLIA